MPGADQVFVGVGLGGGGLDPAYRRRLADIVDLTDDGQHRAGDIGQRDELAADGEATGHHPVVGDELFEEFGDGRPRPGDPALGVEEAALLATRADIREELDRLTAHVAAARALLAEGGPVGRKLDFLAQEFNRETNTLCAKANDRSLTALGLDLKAAVDQLREQVQNLE